MGNPAGPDLRVARQRLLGRHKLDAERLKAAVKHLKLSERQGIPLEQALVTLKSLSGGDEELVEAARNEIERERNDIRTMRPVTVVARGAEPWFREPRDNASYWPDYRRHLEERGWSSDSLDALERESSWVLGRCGCPYQEIDFKVRGLVVGHVQAGKTANMIGVCAHAADEGYRLILVLSGLTNALRKQTQGRFNADLIDHSCDWNTYTSEDNDFQNAIEVITLTDPYRPDIGIAVVKKNKHVLRRVNKLIERTSLPTLRKRPTLIIDDECDQASVNTQAARDRLSAINAQIREMIDRLPKVTYVGYTATPFANVLIDPSYPTDLYPKDFMVALDEKPGYFGTRQLFGSDFSDADQPDDALDVVRIVTDEEANAVIGAVGGSNPNEFPIIDGLDAALRWFLITSAVRALRNDEPVNNSMLINVSHRVNAHAAVSRGVTDWITEVQSRLKHAPEHEIKRFRKLFVEEVKRLPLIGRENWEEVVPSLLETIARTEVHIENGLSNQRLDFSERRSRIIVGGNILSRGLTIEGLTVSYFLRQSKQYDSLMQMGRWFGYRPGYEDLPRIWTAAATQEAFRNLARVEFELRDEIDSLAEQGLTPMECAVKIRQLPGLLITGRDKMHAAQAHVAYWGQHIQTRRFAYRDGEWLKGNWQAAESLVRKIREQGKTSTSSREGILFKGVRVNEILEFLSEYRISEPDAKGELNPEALSSWIQERADTTDALGLWNVGVVQPRLHREGRSIKRFEGLSEVALLVRSRLKGTGEFADIKALMSRQDLLIDCPDNAQASSEWSSTKKIRATCLAGGDEAAVPPLLLLYPIDPISEPVRENSDREALKAADAVMGLGLCFPGTADTQDGTFVSVPLPEEPDPTEADEEFDQLGDAGESEDG